MPAACKQGEIWMADLNPHFGTEIGKVWPVVIVQTDLLNGEHPSTIICPISTNVQPGADILRVHLNKKNSGLEKKSDILADQIRTIDNCRLKRRVGKITTESLSRLLENLRVILDIG
ncbi:MAG: type II toxin-antitoxin system PemK/MazF family toxin [Ignavibacteriota bacterium]